MSETEYPNVEDTHVAHEAEVDEAIDAQMRRTSDEAAIADIVILDADPIVDAASAPGVAYVQAEADAVFDEVIALNAHVAALEAAVDALIGSHNKVLAVLRDAELIPTAPPGPPQ